MHSTHRSRLAFRTSPTAEMGDFAFPGKAAAGGRMQMPQRLATAY
jgi:hypothetical protein